MENLELRVEGYREFGVENWGVTESLESRIRRYRI